MSVTAPSEAREQYLYLTRLAWSLRLLGADVVLELGTAVPVVAVRRGPGDRLRVTAVVWSGRWVYAWGRGRRRWADADESAARVIMRAAR
ncbi:hypothetical protein [Spongiactinospora sp. TRM90649]|uniref:hypothetical protein n=1 Tax=Spongiactinospora sp. TRM90649 TaxID=3031114 RepID=UPI0023F8E91B|nr:hypothetical protein [Spongiactinospora sp. TRM90649]MDF5751280.1 hypothetical protein [Spongiactinospora sp. TRM90649]